MCIIGPAMLDTVLSQNHGPGGYTDADDLQRGGAGLTDEELTQLAKREVLVLLDDGLACRESQKEPTSNLAAFLGYMQREGYASAVKPGFNLVARVARGQAPWKNTDSPNCEPPGSGSSPATACSRRVGSTSTGPREERARRSCVRRMLAAVTH
jgi:hypothetical protein